MAKTSKATPQTDNLGNGKVDSVDTTNTNTPAVDATKLLVAKMKGLGLDSKGLYTEWNNGALDSDGNNGAVDMIDFMVSKKKLTVDDKTAILDMFAKMQAANAPKVKTTKPVPEGLAEDLAQAWITRQEVLGQYKAAKQALDVLWTPAVDASKLELDAACAAVVAAGLFVDRKTGTIKATKTGSTASDGTHANAGKAKLQIGWTIVIGGVSYAGWKDVAKNLITSEYKGNTPTNYPASTKVVEKAVALGLPIEVFVKPTFVSGDKAAALEAWENSASKKAIIAHPSIVVHVS